MNNVIQTENGTIIFNGGNPLKGCPTSWEEANKWIEEANGENEDGPLWSFDCGFKLDYDGSLLSISSRFYPPTTHGGPTWDGRVTLLFLDKEIREKKFDCKTLDELKAQVEAYVKELEIELTKQLFQK
jgi:hypothetical protein